MVKTVLITGGAGFIGSNYVYFHRNKYPSDTIINLDKLTYAGNKDNLKAFEKDQNHHFIHGDICDVELVNNVFGGTYHTISKPDLIIHFAAETHVDRSIEGAGRFIQTNVYGTDVLLAAAVKHGNIRFHHVSTDEVFGSLGAEGFFDEQTPYNPQNPYAASKAAADHLVRAYRNTYDLPVTISNCSNNYGSFHHPEKLIPLFITNLMQDKKVPLYGDGLNVRDWLYTQDHCEAIDTIINKGKIGETYCIGGHNEKTNKEIAGMILKTFNKNKSYIQHVQDRPGHDRRYAIDASKMEKELGWKPKITFEEGLQKTIEWYKQNTWWWQPLVNNYMPQNVCGTIKKNKIIREKIAKRIGVFGYK